MELRGLDDDMDVLGVLLSLSGRASKLRKGLLIRDSSYNHIVTFTAISSLGILEWLDIRFGISSPYITYAFKKKLCIRSSMIQSKDIKIFHFQKGPKYVPRSPLTSRKIFEFIQT
jgi:hypothetical protein